MEQSRIAPRARGKQFRVESGKEEHSGTEEVARKKVGVEYVAVR